MKVLFIGDVVGKPARLYLKEALCRVVKKLNLDLVIANGENAAGGSSITPSTAKELFDAGIDIVTSGDHIFKKKESQQVLETYDVLRPLNYGEKAIGRGFLIKEVKGLKVGVINLLGRVFMQPADCPFQAVDKALKEIIKETKIIIVDMHAEATSEKLALGYFLSGRVSAVIGTHTHIPTADERIIDNFTAYLTDVGMTGSFNSVLGREKDQIIQRFITNMPVRFNLAQNDIRIQAVLIEIDEDSGRALSIKRLEYKKDDFSL
ncbi:MAG: TIGR00282 family metallophosphoesterase [Candidatus Omnitrophica bacterium]|jgi:metallophosphoesterase (TIGR00282 family)|nr:TIGR00282 family metallophosphoesterase [Candidatus Omnitrophota bacterium]